MSVSILSDPAVAICPLCRAGRCITLLDRPRVAVLSNRYYPTRADALAAPSARLHVVSCGECGFVFNSHFDPSRIRYDADYENDQAGSRHFAQHLDGIRSRLFSLTADRTTRLLEIGCGQGRFLEALVAQAGCRIEAVGYDPAWRRRPLPLGLRIVAGAFGAGTIPASEKYDLILARHVIEHIADPVGLLTQMARALQPGGRVCLETPSLDWILSANQMQDFFYEHCNYFTARSLAEACRRAGLGAVRVEPRFGGQYLWAEAQFSGATGRPEPAIGKGRFDAGFFPRWHAALLARREKGAIALWGAGAKGVTFAAEADPTADLITCLIDTNPNKQGRFAGRSGHPILSPRSAVDLGIGTIVVMNPNYREEIARIAHAVGLTAELLPC